jgi:TonB-dependent receptor
VSFTAYQIEFVDGDVQGTPPKVRGGSDYTNWLPGLQARWAIRDDLILRAAWTNTLGRPSPEQNVPYRLFEIDTVDDGIFEAELEAGNPDLKALESANYDLALEWYLEPAGLLSVGAFFKDIDNPIFERFVELEDVDFEGRFYEELFIVQPQNARSGQIFGLEFNYQQQFRMLPGPLSGLGVSLSYTWTDSEAEIFDRDKEVPFFLQSDDVANVALFYEISAFELRLAYAYRSAYLDAVGEEAEQDLYVDDHGQLDFKASFAFTDQITGYVQVQNLTGEPLVYYSGRSSRLAEYEYYSWNMLAGVKVKF